MNPVDLRITLVEQMASISKQVGECKYMLLALHCFPESFQTAPERSSRGAVLTLGQTHGAQIHTASISLDDTRAETQLTVRNKSVPAHPFKTCISFHERLKPSPSAAFIPWPACGEWV